MRKHVARKPATLAQTMRRRILLTGESGTVSTTTEVLGTGLAGVLVVVVAGGPAGGGTLPVEPGSLKVLSTWKDLR